MKTSIFITGFIILIFSIVVVEQSCKKEDENVKEPPACNITSPSDGAIILKGKTVKISVDVKDNDGYIVQVRFIIDNIGITSTTYFPYYYDWETSDSDFGDHIIEVQAFDNDGNETSDKITITLVEESYFAPECDFTASQTSGTGPLIVQFTDQSTNNPTSWEWYFGDGGTSTDKNPTHTYNLPGLYTVSLRSYNKYGSGFKSKTDFINVSLSVSSFTDMRDGQTYTTVVIGEQEWFTQNLNYESDDSWCYDDNSGNCDEYGRLYSWDAAMTACPDGWHLPSDDEWKLLETQLGMSQSEADKTGERGTDQGTKLKSKTGWSGSGNGTDIIGFSALPGGYHNSNGSYSIGDKGFWWTSSDYNNIYKYYRSLSFSSEKVYRNFKHKSYHYSVRCVRD